MEWDRLKSIQGSYVHGDSLARSAFSRKALDRRPNSPWYALPSNSMSMASCLLLSRKFPRIVRCTERAPSFSWGRGEGEGQGVVFGTCDQLT